MTPTTQYGKDDPEGKTRQSLQTVHKGWANEHRKLYSTSLMMREWKFKTNKHKLPFSFIHQISKQFKGESEETWRYTAKEWKLA